MAGEPWAVAGRCVLIRPRRDRLHHRTCRGFGEKYGTCTNAPRERRISVDVVVPTLCASCENAFRANQMSLAGLKDSWEPAELLRTPEIIPLTPVMPTPAIFAADYGTAPSRQRGGRALPHRRAD